MTELKYDEQRSLPCKISLLNERSAAFSAANRVVNDMNAHPLLGNKLRLRISPN